jgi:hypothetical protein
MGVKKGDPAVTEVIAGPQDVVEFELALFPVENAFFDGVNVSDGHESEKTGHAPKDARTMSVDHRFEIDGPRIEEDDLDIEKDEEHRHEVKLHRESRLGFSLRDHAALVGHIFGLGALRRLSEQDADCQRHNAKTEDDSDL